MDDANQLPLPPSFVALYVAPGQHRPGAPRDEIAARHEFCEDLATALTERAGALLWELGITEADVLERMQAGLGGEGSALTPPEARWVLCRVAELLDWPQPSFSDAPAPPSA